MMRDRFKLEREISILGNRMKQIAGDDSLQIQGKTIHVGMSYAEIKDLCTTLIQSELALYTQKANEEAWERFESILEKFLDALKNIDEKYRMRFQEPAIQFAANETFKEYIRSGKEELGDDLIDLMIERMQVDEYSAKRMLIDEARQVLPKLSSASVAILGILTFTKFIFFKRRGDFIEMLRKLSPLILQIGMPQNLDIACLEQARCGQSLSFVTSYKEFVEIMMDTYAPIFTRSIPNEMFEKILVENHWNQGDVKLFLSIHTLFQTEGNSQLFNISTISKNSFAKDNPTLRNAATILLDVMPKFSEKEVKQFFLDINPEWENVIRLFHMKRIHSFMISPVGYYIALRKLTRLLGEEIPLDMCFD